MFNKNKNNNVSSDDVSNMIEPIVARIDKLETALKNQAKQIVELQNLLKGTGTIRQGDGEKGSETFNLASETQLQIHEECVDRNRTSSEKALTADDMASKDNVLSRSVETLYLPAPTPDGLFMEYSPTEQVGKSVYQLRTEDGINGQFIMIDTSDAIATAMISISQIVKPVCRIEGNTKQYPRRIKTLEEGVAQRDGAIWRVTKKAKLSFE